ncbi:hypothetical protein D3C78_794380 [compost metagenome]
MLAQQALAAEQHVTVKERVGQGVVGIVRRTGALVDILSKEVQFQVAADLRAWPTVADPMQDDLLGGVQGGHHPTVLLGQFKATGFDVHLADRLEQRRFELEVKPQLAKQPRQALLHRLVGEQCLPQHRQQAVPGGAGDQQHRFMPEIGDRATALVHADHGVDRQNQGGRGNRTITFAQCPEHGQAKARQRQGKHEDVGVGEQPLDRERGNAEAHQCHRQRIQAALPAVIGLGQGAGDDPQEQRDQQAHLVLVPTQRHAAGQGDEHPNAVAELIQCPKATQRLTKRSR